MAPGALGPDSPSKRKRGPERSPTGTTETRQKSAKKRAGSARKANKKESRERTKREARKTNKKRAKSARKRGGTSRTLGGEEKYECFSVVTYYRATIIVITEYHTCIYNMGCAEIPGKYKYGA